MGDMKTPDFDDLLAAFDIPDMVDPKAAIESGHDDLKPGMPPEDGAHTPSSAPDVGVSVIVKNVRGADTTEHAQVEKEVRPHTAMANGLHNGFLAMSPTDRYRTNGVTAPHHRGLADSNLSPFNQFSPISSAEEFDEDDKIEVDDPVDKLSSQKTFTPPAPNSLDAPLTKRKEQTAKPLSEDGVAMSGTSEDCDQPRTDQNNNSSSSTLGSSKLYDSAKPRRVEEQANDLVTKPLDGTEAGEQPCQAAVPALPKAKSSAKLSSCIAAIAALSAKKATAEPGQSEPLAPQRASPKEARESPRIPERSAEQESATGATKAPSSNEPGSPSSVTSEASSTGSTPVIPKVRIKTIKTSSGQIKRTVTRVLPECDPEGQIKRTVTRVLSESDPEGLEKGDISSTSVVASTHPSPSMFSTQTRTSPPSGGATIEIAKHMAIKPLATAYLPVSAVKTAGSQVINLKLANNSTVKATVIPATAMQSASSAILKAANAIQQQTILVPASSLANTKLVPKTVHLTNLLLPRTTSGMELHQVLAKPQQQQTATPTPKKVNRVQVLASSQSSVVEAFNKVLSSINPVPLYVPNLSPPSAACISLPSRGYKCLECGDSFALERSLTHHYDRRSVRIEVTCNHCAKNLVFYNKCSLLSHARGHKDKGVVMQCSHLILKPIPADQMIPTAPSTGGSAQTRSATGQPAEKGPHTAVISAPSSTPQVAALPLDEDPSGLCRHGLKCLECNETFLEENLLTMHFQKALEISGQKTCTICQMLLPNLCSFASHQRIHQHKSPYICPECGAICRSVHFQSHVTRSCLHYTRRVGYRCVHCSVIFADIASLKSHIQSSHCEVFYKCAICPMAFKSAPGTHAHGYTQHPGMKIGEPKLIYKCSMCDTVFTQQTLLYSHFDQHISSHKVSVFKCPDCATHYAQKQLMLDHIKAMHGTLRSVEGPPNLGINLPLSTKPTNPLSSSPNNREGGTLNGLDRGDKKPFPSPIKKGSSAAPASKEPLAPGWTCGDCDRLFTQREVFVAHMRREHGKHLKKHPCHQCDKSFSSSHSLCRHNRIKHKGLQRKIYSCPHCPGLSPTYTKRLLLDKHIQLMHDIKEPEGKNTDKVEETADKVLPPAPSTKRTQDEDEASTGIRSRVSDAQPLKKLKVNVFKVHKCAVCGFTTEEIVTFYQHIPQHKSDGVSFQCRECGLCYTSHPSLARHLFIVHRLKEPHGLVRRKGTAGDDDDDDDESQRENQRGPGDRSCGGTSETRCKVCKKMFETETSLNTHMRTHGMAFIKSKRLSMAEK